MIFATQATVTVTSEFIVCFVAEYIPDKNWSRQVNIDAIINTGA